PLTRPAPPRTLPPFPTRRSSDPYTVAGLHGDILDTIDLIGRRRRDDAGIGLKPPKLLAGPCVVGAELAVIGPAREDETAASGKHRSPHHRARIQVPPGPLASVHVEGLQFTIEARLRVDGEVQVRNSDTGPPLPRNTLLNLAFQGVAVVLIGRDVHHPGLWIVRLVWPVLAAPQAGAELR